jgi:hypothetical protein
VVVPYAVPAGAGRDVPARRAAPAADAPPERSAEPYVRPAAGGCAEAGDRAVPEGRGVPYTPPVGAGDVGGVTLAEARTGPVP